VYPSTLFQNVEIAKASRQSNDVCEIREAMPRG
jgi:hypothetical protein